MSSLLLPSEEEWGVFCVKLRLEICILSFFRPGAW